MKRPEKKKNQFKNELFHIYFTSMYKILMIFEFEDGDEIFI